MTDGQAKSLGSISSTLTSGVITLGVAVLLFVWPVFAFVRVQEVRDANLGVQLRPEDPMLLIAGGLWIGVLLSAISAWRPLRRVPNSVTDLKTGFRGAIKPTYFGVGDYRGWTQTNPIAQLSDLEAPMTDTETTQSQTDLDVLSETAGASEPLVGAVTAAPMSPSATTGLPTLTTLYTVGRRESWWSISEALFNDARDWDVIRDLNIGREVADGMTIAADTPLRSGWSLVVPVELSRRAADAANGS